MEPPQSNGEDLLRQKFPNLTPVKSMPSLWSLNGFGARLYGRRDHDAETGTYIKTRCLSLLFVPVLALDAYRVADAPEGGWYILGRERLSGFARNWNIACAALVFVLIVSFMAQAHFTGPDYAARQDLKAAQKLEQRGQLPEAAAVYRRVATGGTARAPEGRQRLRETAEKWLASESPQTAARAFEFVAYSPATVHQDGPLVPDLFQRGTNFITRHRAAQPELALTVLDSLAKFVPKGQDLKSARKELLADVVRAQPDNLSRAVELALVYEGEPSPTQAVAVLLPLKARLASTEGARILGQHYLQAGQNHEAYPLLDNYVQSRLSDLRQVEMAYTNAVFAAQKRAIDALQQGRAGQSFYTQYQAAAKAAQETQVRDYVHQRIRNDPQVARLTGQFKAANKIVGVALDLGILQLDRALGMKAAAARRDELEAAEKTFLAIGGLAGDSEDYKLFLGQVYFWLGKTAQGKALFDELLEAGQRSFKILMSLAHTYRNLGDHASARELAEEAYRNSKVTAEKYAAAGFRSRAQKDLDDQIAWLEKCDLTDPGTQIELNAARGAKAISDGNRPLATRLLKEAVNGYDKLTKSPATLNNCALACFALHEASGDLAYRNRGLAMLQEAVDLDPDDSILMANTVHVLLDQAVNEVVQPQIRTEALGGRSGLDLLRYLYQDEPGRARTWQRLRENEVAKKALVLLDRALVLAPKDAGLNEKARALYTGFRDLDGLRKLQERQRAAGPDLAELKAKFQELYSGARDQEYRESFRKREQWLEELLKKPAVAGDPLTRQSVAVSLVQARLGSFSYGATVDFRKMLELAQSLHQENPTSMSRGTLLIAHYQCAADALAVKSAEFAKLAAASGRALPRWALLCLLVERHGPIAELVRQDPDFQQAVALERESLRLFPDWPSLNAWAILRHTDPSLAAGMAESYRACQLCQANDELEYRSNPYSPYAVVERCWGLQMAGDNQAADQLYRQALKEGVALPPLDAK